VTKATRIGSGFAKYPTHAFPLQLFFFGIFVQYCRFSP
jgi:hypothetical protein